MYRRRLLYFIFLLTSCIMLISVRSIAQAVPDTSLNKVFPDSTKRTELRTVHIGTNSNHITIDSSKVGVDSSHTAGINAAPTTDTSSDIPAKHEPFQPKPKKSGMYSAICPGLGQLYNQQYWKIPVIYAGIAIAGYFIASNLDNYQTYRTAYISALSTPNNRTDKFANIYSVTQLQQLQSQYEQYLDLSVLFTGIGYALQVLDAVTYAHLKNFDISRDLSMKMQPVAFPRGAGVGLVFNWK